MQASLELTEEQQSAVRAAEAWWRSPLPAPIFCIAGYAGTGKTTVVRHVIDELGVPEHKVAFLSFTGKAALVMRRKGLQAQTIHSLIYAPVSGEDEKVEFGLRELLEVDYRLFVVDEVSMVSEVLLRDLMTFEVPILALGDPAQLPPVEGGSCRVLDRPDAFLRQIHRQAAGNPILWASRLARDGEPIPLGDHGEALQVIRPRDVYASAVDLAAFDQVIVCTNKTRKWFNETFRRRRDFEGALPVAGDRLISLRNVRKIWSSSSNTPLVNGLQCVAAAAPWDVDLAAERCFMRVTLEDDVHSVFEALETDLWPITQRGPKPPKANARLPQFDFGYAITAHKSQGSEWDRVLFIADLFGDPVEQRQLLYTGVTRAARHLTLAIAEARR